MLKIIFYVSIATFLISSCNSVTSKENSNAPKKENKENVHFSSEEFTSKVNTMLLDSIKSESKTWREKLLKDGFSEKEINFSIDTFKINQYSSRKMIYFYSTNGMNKVVNEETDKYDSLMNCYYSKLKKELSTNDHLILKKAQLSWIDFRDKELYLISLLRHENYSGGGTMQSNIFTGMKNSLVKQRTIELFEHYNGIYK